VEMKTSRLIENERQQNTFSRFKTQKWWAQSFMVSIFDVFNTLNIENMIRMLRKLLKNGKLEKMRSHCQVRVRGFKTLNPCFGDLFYAPFIRIKSTEAKNVLS
jgi:hypothetical protein